MNEFIAWFKQQPQRRDLERTWQGNVLDHTISYLDEPGNLMVEAELKQIFDARTARLQAAS